VSSLQVFNHNVVCIFHLSNAYYIFVLGERIFFKWEVGFKEIGWDVDWMHFVQYRYQWRAIVNTVTNLSVP
jgi:hypothetical protein